MARRIALIVGVGEYTDFARLQSSARDAETVAHVLRAVAGFEDVQLLVNPSKALLEEKVELLFTDNEPDDLVLFYFSGHGVKDERGALYFAVSSTRRHTKGELVRATAVACQHVRDAMSTSRSRRQVVILDCCFSGAFAEGMQAKDGGRVDLSGQLGGEGKAILASSSSTQYSFDAVELGLSTYTQFLVQGIATGDADLNHDGWITVDELHEFARSHVQTTRPSMTPQILPCREGYKIHISKAQRVDPKRAYAAKVREVADLSGMIPALGVEILNTQRKHLGLQELEARAIQEAELGPIRTRAQARAKLRKVVFTMRRKRKVDNTERSLVNELRVALDLSEQDLRGLLEEPMDQQRRKVRGGWYWPEQLGYMTLLGLLAVGLIVGFMKWRTGGVGVQTPEIRPSALPVAANLTTTPPPVQSVANGALDEILRVDHSGTTWAIRISADNTLNEARDVAATALRSSRFQPWIVHETFSPHRYFVFVGGYTQRSRADADRSVAGAIIREGAIVESMSSVCPKLTWNPGGYHDCEKSSF